MATTMRTDEEVAAEIAAIGPMDDAALGERLKAIPEDAVQELFDALLARAAEWAKERAASPDEGGGDVDAALRRAAEQLVRVGALLVRAARRRGGDDLAPPRFARYCFAIADGVVSEQSDYYDVIEKEQLSGLDDCVAAAKADDDIVYEEPRPRAKRTKLSAGNSIVLIPEQTQGNGTDVVYVYFPEAERKLSAYEQRCWWPCKVGFTSGSLTSRILQQGVTTSMPCLPVVGVALKTPNGRGLERTLHFALEDVGVRVTKSVGSEWFYTSPDRIVAWYEALQRANDLLRIAPPTSEHAAMPKLNGGPCYA